MTDLTDLFEQIEQLPPEQQADVAKFVEFLRWQDIQRRQQEASEWSFSFIEAFKEASIFATDKPAGMDVTMAPASVGGESRPALWAHPPVTGQTVIEFHVPVPQQIHQTRLNLAVGIRDGAEITENNLVAFGVRVNGLRVWGTQSNALAWQDVAIPLKITPGDIIRVEFTTEALGSHKWTWAVWGKPELTGKITS